LWTGKGRGGQSSSVMSECPTHVYVIRREGRGRVAVSRRIARQHRSGPLPKLNTTGTHGMFHSWSVLACLLARSLHELPAKTQRGAYAPALTQVHSCLQAGTAHTRRMRRWARCPWHKRDLGVCVHVCVDACLPGRHGTVLSVEGGQTGSIEGGITAERKRATLDASVQSTD
jgi:hypothetical protein